MKKGKIIDEKDSIMSNKIIENKTNKREQESYGTASQDAKPVK